MVAADAVAVEEFVHEFLPRMLPDNVRAEFYSLQDCVAPEDIQRLLPDAYVWLYLSGGDWGASYGHSLIVRLSYNLALVIEETFDDDDHEYKRYMDIKWLRPETNEYTVIASWNNVNNDGNNPVARAGWRELQANYPAPMRIPDEFVECMRCWSLRWNLSKFAGLEFHNDTICDDAAY
jgi:hypothetical protein